MTVAALRVTTLLPVLLTAIVGGACASDVWRDVGWLAKQGVGQAELLVAGRRVDAVVADPTTDPRVKRRLRLVQAARTFAKDSLGLTVTNQYETAVFLTGPAVVFVVSAAEVTSLAPYTWDYPVLGALPYRGFFSLEEAEGYAQELAATGLDVDVRPVRTYSLLGFLPDPIVSSMLFASDEASLVETVIHELAHATVFANGQGAFNEGLATFIGTEGARLFIDRFYGENSAIAARFVGIKADQEMYTRAVGALAFDLRVLFAQARVLGRADLLRRRDTIFLSHQQHFDNEVRRSLETFVYRGARLPNNNAELAAFSIYAMKQELYRRAYVGCGESMPCFIRILRDVARTADPELALAEQVRDGAPEERLIR
jgi:predicted aminopeptidase